MAEDKGQDLAVQEDEEEYRLTKNIDDLERKARRERLDGPHVRYLRDNVASERAFRILADNEQRFGALESPEAYDLRRDPQARESRIQELRQVIADAQRELTTLGEEEVSSQVAGQVPLNADGSVSDLHDPEAGPEEREAKYRAMNKEALQNEIDRRNQDGREDGDKMSTSGTKPELVNRLVEDDAWLDEVGDEEQ